MAADLIDLLARHILSIGLCLSWFNSSVHIAEPDTQPYSQGLSWRLPRGAILVSLVLGSLLFLSLAEAFAMAWLPGWTGLALLLMIVVVRHFESRTWQEGRVKELGKYSPSGAALFGYEMGYWLAWEHEASTRDVVAWEVAAGVMAAAWFLTGWHKLRKSGLAWFTSRPIALLVAERVQMSHGLFRAPRLWLMHSPRVCQAFGSLGVVAELSCVLYVIPVMRWPITAVLESMLVLIFILLGYFEIEWMVVMLAVTLAST